MKPLLVLLRIVVVGCLWSIIFTEGIRVIMLENWRFDIFWPLHWIYAWNLWLSGWVIDTPKEWAFILIIISFIPLWLTGWIALSMVAWEKMIYKILMFPLYFIIGQRVNLRPVINKTPVVVKKKSYKEIRPTGHRSPIRDYSGADKTVVTPPVAAKTSISNYNAQNNRIKEKAANLQETFSHSLFNLDDEEDFDLDFDTFEKSNIFDIDAKKSKKQAGNKNEKYSFEDDQEDEMYDNSSKKTNRYSDDDIPSRKKEDTYERKDRDNRRDRKERDNKLSDRDDNRYEERIPRKRSSEDTYKNSRDNTNVKEISQSAEKTRGNNPIVDVLTQRGYDIISGITIKNTTIDFIAVSDSTICLCLVDKETGDWLADEERFNNEEPLWFSENSHRISPVRKVTLAKEILSRRLEDANFDIEIKPYVIVQMGNIINAEDMFEVWDDIGVDVTRINRGSPKEIKLFSKTVEEADGKLSREEFNTLKKILRGG